MQKESKIFSNRFGILQSIVKPFETINICTIAQKEDFCLSGIGRCRMADEGRKCRTVRRNAGRMATLLPGRNQTLKMME